MKKRIPTGADDEAILDAAALDALEGRQDVAADDPIRFTAAYVEARAGFDEVVSMLAFAGPSQPPPASVKKRLMDRVAAESAMKPRQAPPARPEGSFDVIPGVSGVRTSDARWLPSPIPGIEYKLVGRDAERGYTTRLVRFSPGARYPRHVHGGTEEIFLLEGSVHVNGKHLKAGDYCRSEAGTAEWGTYTDEGGLALIVSSDQDDVDTA